MTGADQIRRFATLGNQDGDGINRYYGAADTSIALANGSITHILGWLDRHGAA
jgi:predicted GH43/DUF377 family glycosyl hydrolase